MSLLDAPYRVIAKVPGEGWQPIGAGRGGGRGSLPRSQSHEFGAPGGTHSFEFVVDRDPRFRHIDLVTGTPVMGIVAGVPVAVGQILEALPDDAGAFTVSCRGPIRHLSEDVSFDKTFVKTGVDAGWYDAREGDNTGSAVHSDAYTIVNEFGFARIGVGIGLTVGNGVAGAIVYDAGPNNTIERLAFQYRGGGNAVGNLQCWSSTNGVTKSEITSLDAAPILTTSQFTSKTFATPRRYVGIELINGSGAGHVVAAATYWLLVTQIIIATSTAYESGNASALVASDVIKHAFQQADTDLVSTDVTGIATTSTLINDWDSDGYISGLDAIENVNMLEGLEWFYDITPLPKPWARVETAAPPTYIAQAADARKIGASNTISDIYNQVRVRWRDGRGIESFTTVALATDRTPLRLVGMTRTLDIEVTRPMTSTQATALANAALAAYSRPNVKQTVTFRNKLPLVSGGYTHPAYLKQYDLVALPWETNEYGARPLVARVTSGQYDHESKTVTAELESRRSFFENQLAKFEATGRWDGRRS